MKCMLYAYFHIFTIPENTTRFMRGRQYSDQVTQVEELEVRDSGTSIDENELEIPYMATQATQVCEDDIRCSDCEGYSKYISANGIISFAFNNLFSFQTYQIG